MATSPQHHNINYQQFTAALREWRRLRKMSQLDLAIEAAVSQRHISWLETGKSKPSREMVIKLSDSLGIPNRERNRLLKCAGFASMYAEQQLEQSDRLHV